MFITISSSGNRVEAIPDLVRRYWSDLLFLGRSTFLLPGGVWQNAYWCKILMECVKRGIVSHLDLKVLSLYVRNSAFIPRRAFWCTHADVTARMLSWRRDSVVSIVTRLRTARSRVRYPSGSWFFSFPERPDRLQGRLCFLFSSNLGFFPREVKWPGLEVDQSRPSDAEGNNEGSCTSAPPARIRDADVDSFTFYVHVLLYCIEWKGSCVSHNTTTGWAVSLCCTTELKFVWQTVPQNTCRPYRIEQHENNLPPNRDKFWFMLRS